MADARPAVVVTGISGNLGLRLLPQLAEFRVIGVDLTPPDTPHELRYVSLDLGEEESTRELYLLIKEYRPAAVVHLAFVIDPVRSGILDVDRMWKINVAGTARMMEAISEANRDESSVKKFIFPSSVSIYGSDVANVTEDAPMAAHSLPYALHKMESDKVVRQRAPGLRGCSVYMLRPHIFAGPSVQNYLMGAFRGTPTGKSKRAERMRKEGKRLPAMLPYGKKYLDNQIQFVHVDDMARLITYILKKDEPEAQRLTVLNVAGKGEAMSFAKCIEMANAKLIRVPGKQALKLVLDVMWKAGISAIPPEALPYLTGQYTMNTDRLRKFLGEDYGSVIQYGIAEAYAESFTGVQ